MKTVNVIESYKRNLKLSLRSPGIWLVALCLFVVCHWESKQFTPNWSDLGLVPLLLLAYAPVCLIHREFVDADEADEAIVRVRKLASEDSTTEQRKRVAAEEERDFFKRMLVRARCGCLALDCRVHGSYSPDDLKRLEALTK